MRVRPQLFLILNIGGDKRKWWWFQKFGFSLHVIQQVLTGCKKKNAKSHRDRWIPTNHRSISSQKAIFKCQTSFLAFLYSLLPSSLLPQRVENRPLFFFFLKKKGNHILREILNCKSTVLRETVGILVYVEPLTPAYTTQPQPQPRRSLKRSRIHPSTPQKLFIPSRHLVRRSTARWRQRMSRLILLRRWRGLQNRRGAEPDNF